MHKMSEAIHDLTAYVQLDDSIFLKILHSDAAAAAAAAAAATAATAAAAAAAAAAASASASAAAAAAARDGDAAAAAADAATAVSAAFAGATPTPTPAPAAGDDELKKAKEILQRIHQRKFYHLIGQTKPDYQVILMKAVDINV
jgi:hypothetical protein